jgi:MerR family transcriptional regulator/heat shock protein HspR
MISAVAEMYGIHPQTLRLYEREGLLKPSRTEGNTRLYTEDDLKRLEFILELARDYGVNISGIDMILRMRENMEMMRKQMDLMQQQMQEFFRYIQTEMLRRTGHTPSPSEGALVPIRRPFPESAALQKNHKKSS